MKNPIVINICSGPSTGKSTLASNLFSKLKKMGYNVEVIQEYAKDLYYEENHNLVSNQIMVSSEQLWRMRRLKNKVDIIITDSPLLLGFIYSTEPNPYFKSMILWEYNNAYINLTYFLERGDLIYQEHGRFHKEEDAKLVDNEILKMLEENELEYKSIKRKGAKKSIISDIQAIIKPTLKTVKSEL